MIDQFVSEFQMLRVRIESELANPGVLVVTAAEPDDGASLTAFGVADSLAATGQRVVLLRLEPQPSGVSSSPLPDFRRVAESSVSEFARPVGSHFLQMLSVASDAGTTIASRQLVAALYKRLRAEFDYAVLDLGELAGSSLAVTLGAGADATLLAFRSGRARVPGDSVLAEFVERGAMKVLGVVLTDRKAVLAFNLLASGREESPTPFPRLEPVAMRHRTSVRGEGERV